MSFLCNETLLFFTVKQTQQVASLLMLRESSLMSWLKASSNAYVLRSEYC